MSQKLIRAWRLSEARYAGDLSEPALIQDLDPKSLPRWLECRPSWSGESSLGRQLVRSGQQLGLVLPSVVVHQARNLLLNPLHPAIAQVSLVPGTVQARSTSGLISFREMPGCLFRGVIFLWLSQQAERAFHALCLLEGSPRPAGRCIHRQQTSFSVPIHSERVLRLQHCLEESKLPPGARLGWHSSLQGKPLLTSRYSTISSRD